MQLADLRRGAPLRLISTRDVRWRLGIGGDLEGQSVVRVGVAGPAVAERVRRELYSAMASRWSRPVTADAEIWRNSETRVTSSSRTSWKISLS